MCPPIYHLFVNFDTPFTVCRTQYAMTQTLKTGFASTRCRSVGCTKIVGEPSFRLYFGDLLLSSNINRDRGRRKHVRILAKTHSGSVEHFCDRHESLAKRWPRKMGNVRLGSRRRILSSRTLGTQRLEVMGILGEGGYATVYACKVDDARRYVAVKVEFQVTSVSFASG